MGVNVPPWGVGRPRFDGSADMQAEAAHGHPRDPQPRRADQGAVAHPGSSSRAIDGGGNPHDPPRRHHRPLSFATTIN